MIIEKYKTWIKEMIDSNFCVSINTLYSHLPSDERIFIWNAAMVLAEKKEIIVEQYEYEGVTHYALFPANTKKLTSKKFRIPNAPTKE